MFLPALAPVAPALQPLDDDAGSGGDAGDTSEDATPVEPGVRHGRLTAGVDAADHYAFHVEAGEGVRIGLWGHGDPEAPFDVWIGGSERVGVELRNPSGDAVPNPRRGLVAEEGGIWTVSVHEVGGTFYRHLLNQSVYTGTDPVFQYTLNLEVRAPWPQDDAGSGGDAGNSLADATPLPAGHSEAELGHFDAVDVYAFDVPAGAAYRFDVDGRSGTWAELLDEAESTRPFAGVVDDDTRLYARVEGGEGPYAMALDIRESSAFHSVVTGLERVGALVPTERGVDAFTDEGLLRVNETGAEPLGPEVFTREAARDAEGRLLGAFPEGILRLDDPEPFPVTPQHGPFAFGPDGNLHVLAPSENGKWALLAVTPDREAHRVVGFGLMDLSQVHHVTFTPDGVLHALDEQRLVSVNVTTGAVRIMDVPDLRPTGVAADAMGRLYVVDEITRGLYRLDPDGHQAAEWLRGRLPEGGKLSGGVELAFAGTNLYVGYAEPDGSTWNARIGYYDLGVEGFSGFTPTFDLPALPDLVITRVEAAPTGDGVDAMEPRRILVEVENRGDGPAPGGFPVDVHTRCGGALEKEVPRWPVDAEIPLDRPDGLPDLALLDHVWVYLDALKDLPRVAERLWNETLFPEPPSSPREDRFICGGYVGQATFGALAPGERATAEIAWDTAGMAGEHWVLAFADGARPRSGACEGVGTLFESDETNNCAFTKTTVLVEGGGVGAQLPIARPPWRT